MVHLLLVDITLAAVVDDFGGVRWYETGFFYADVSFPMGELG
jgi:hypothetical protein